MISAHPHLSTGLTSSSAPTPTNTHLISAVCKVSASSASPSRFRKKKMSLMRVKDGGLQWRIDWMVRLDDMGGGGKNCSFCLFEADKFDRNKNNEYRNAPMN